MGGRFETSTVTRPLDTVELRLPRYEISAFHNFLDFYNFGILFLLTLLLLFI